MKKVNKLFKTKNFVLILSISLLVGFITFQSSNQVHAVNNFINFQTKITTKADGLNLNSDNTSCIVAGPNNDTCDFRVRIWNVPTGGSATPGNNLMYEELHQNVEIGETQGTFNLLINSICNAQASGNHQWSTTLASASVCNIIDDNDADSIAGVSFDRENLWVEITFDPSGTWTNLASPPVGIEVFSRSSMRTVFSVFVAQYLTGGFTSDDFVKFAPATGQTTSSTNSLIKLTTTANTTNPLILLNETGAGTPDFVDLRVASDQVFRIDNQGSVHVAGDLLSYNSTSDIGTSAMPFANIHVAHTRADRFYFANDNFIDYGSNAFRFNIAGTPVFEITNTGDIRMNDGSTKNIVNYSGRNLVQITDVSTNFGAYVEAGAMISRNSYFGEEFFRKRANVTADADFNWGDYTHWSTREQANGTNDCTFLILDNTINGISRIRNEQNNTWCRIHLADNDGTLFLTYNITNLPVVVMKVRLGFNGANDAARFGLGQNPAGGYFTVNGLYFGHNTTNWYGVATTTSPSSGTTTLNCTGQVPSTTQFGLFKIEVHKINEVHYYVDPDVSNGISWHYCGSVGTNIPTHINLSPFVGWFSNGGTSRFVDIDYFRVWQDDAPAVELDMLNTLIINNSDVDLTSTEEEGGKEKEIDFEETQEEAVEELEEAEQPTQEEPVSDAGVGTEEEQAVETGEERLLRQIAEVTGLRFESIEDVGEIKISGMINGAKMQIETPELNILGNLIVSGTLIIEGDLEVRGDIKARGEIYLGRDSIGEAKIEANSTEVRVEYEEEKRKIPYVIVTPKKMMEEGYEIVDSDEKGFTIMIAEPQTEVVVFRWLIFNYL